MTRFTRRLVAFLKREDGPTAVEYDILLALIIGICIAAVTELGRNAKSTFRNESLNNALSAEGD